MISVQSGCGCGSSCLFAFEFMHTLSLSARSLPVAPGTYEMCSRYQQSAVAGHGSPLARSCTSVPRRISGDQETAPRSANLAIKSSPQRSTGAPSHEMLARENCTGACRGTSRPAILTQGKKNNKCY